MSAAFVPDEVADRLYALPPGEFIAGRDEAVRAARAEGDKPRAAALAKLRRPTVAAWLVNLLARRRSALVSEFLALGDEIRRAQQGLRGPALRDLATRRRTAVHALVNEAVALAAEAGASRSGLPTAEVEATLASALSDQAMANAVRAGRVVKAGEYAGFGIPDRPALHVVPDPAEKSGTGAAAGTAFEDAWDEPAPPPRRTEVAKPRSGRPSDAAVARVESARAAVEAAERGYDEAVSTVDRRTREVAEIEEQLDDLRRRRVEAHAALLDAHAAQDVASAGVESARRQLGAAERAARRGV